MYIPLTHPPGILDTATLLLEKFTVSNTGWSRLYHNVIVRVMFLKIPFLHELCTVQNGYDSMVTLTYISKDINMLTLVKLMDSPRNNKCLHYMLKQGAVPCTGLILQNIVLTLIYVDKGLYSNKRCWKKENIKVLIYQKCLTLLQKWKLKCKWSMDRKTNNISNINNYWPAPRASGSQIMDQLQWKDDFYFIPVFLFQYFFSVHVQHVKGTTANHLCVNSKVPIRHSDKGQQRDSTASWNIKIYRIKNPV